MHEDKSYTLQPFHKLKLFSPNVHLPDTCFHVFVQESFMFLCLQRNKIFKVWCIVINFL